MQKSIVDFADDETECGTGSYSCELRGFSRGASDKCANNRPTPLCVELEKDLISTAKKMAYGDNTITSPRMPAWMLAYFAELKRKAISPPSISVSERPSRMKQDYCVTCSRGLDDARNPLSRYRSTVISADGSYRARTHENGFASLLELIWCGWHSHSIAGRSLAAGKQQSWHRVEAHIRGVSQTPALQSFRTWVFRSMSRVSVSPHLPTPGLCRIESRSSLALRVRFPIAQPQAYGGVGTAGSMPRIYASRGGSSPRCRTSPNRRNIIHCCWMRGFTLGD